MTDFDATSGPSPSGQAPAGLDASRFDPGREAIAVCEAFINQALVRRNVTEEIEASAEWQRLKLTPVYSIDAAPDCAVDIDSAGDGWVRAMVVSEAPLSVSYAVGMAASFDEAPEPLKMGIERLAEHVASGRADNEIPAAVAALWRPYRRMRLA